MLDYDHHIERDTVEAIVTAAALSPISPAEQRAPIGVEGLWAHHRGRYELLTQVSAEASRVDLVSRVWVTLGTGPGPALALEDLAYGEDDETVIAAALERCTRLAVATVRTWSSQQRTEVLDAALALMVIARREAAQPLSFHLGPAPAALARVLLRGGLDAGVIEAMIVDTMTEELAARPSSVQPGFPATTARRILESAQSVEWADDDVDLVADAVETHLRGDLGSIAARASHLRDQATAAQQERDAAIRDAHQQGVSLTDIASTTGLTKARIHAIVNR